MTGWQTRLDGAARNFALFCLVVLMLLRALVPTGWMPAASGDGFTITICTSDGRVSAWLDADGTIHRDAPGDDGAGKDSPCLFALGIPPLPAMAAAIVAKVAFVILLPTPTLIDVAIGRGLAAPPPPPTGPPTI